MRWKKRFPLPGNRIGRLGCREIQYAERTPAGTVTLRYRVLPPGVGSEAARPDRVAPPGGGGRSARRDSSRPEVVPGKEKNLYVTRNYKCGAVWWFRGQGRRRPNPINHLTIRKVNDLLIVCLHIDCTFPPPRRRVLPPSLPLPLAHLPPVRSPSPGLLPFHISRIQTLH